MAFLLNHLIAEAVRYQGMDAFDIREATGGSATSFIDTGLEDKYGDDELKDGSIIVLRTAAQLAPMGEFSRISAWSEGTTLAAISTLGGSIASGDTCMIVSPEYPLRLLIELANDALRDCGEVSYQDDSTTTVADHKEYTLSAEYKNLIDVYVQGNKDDADINEWIRISRDDWYIEPSFGNTDTRIVFRDAFEAGYKLRFVYNGFHPEVKAYNSPISESIPKPLIVLMLADKIMQWYGVTNENSNYANKISAELERAKAMYPLRKEKKSSKFFTYRRL
jgi:hypothetical protein